MTAPVRRAAHDVLRAVHTERADLASALERSRQSLNDSRDRALVGDIILGVCRWRGALDHIIGQLSSRPLSAVDAVVLDILRVAAYQLLHLDRVPRHAVVADAVALTREAGAASASGFVNAILRSLAEQRRPVSLPAPPACEAGTPVDRAAALDYLSVTLSHPRWLVERWLHREGWSAAAAWARFNNRAAPTTLRPNLAHGSRAELQVTLTAHGIRTTPTRLAPHGLVVTEGHLTIPPVEDGTLVVQEEAAQLVVELAAALIDPASEAPLLDLCAAPGGKTIGLAASRGARLVVASDLRRRRMALLAETVRRHRMPDVALVRLDAEAPLPFGAVFGGILVDAPCSGLGIIRRDPDIRWRRNADQLAGFADRQLAMLTYAASVLRPDGWLVYATCSSEPEENDAVVRRFLEANPTFSVSRPVSPTLAPLVNDDGFLRTLPYRDGVDAFFGAAFCRTIP